jgi:hypothetical protein
MEYLKEIKNLNKYENIKTLLLNKIKCDKKREEINQNLTIELIIKNESHLKLCPLMLKKIKKICKNDEIEYIEIADHSIIKYKYKNKENIITDRACKNDTCRYAHKEIDLRVPYCLLNLFDCCDRNNNCKYIHASKSEILNSLPEVVLTTKKYYNENKEEIFKIFYYTNCVRIYNYKNYTTSVLHLSPEDKNNIYDLMVEKYNNIKL